MIDKPRVRVGIVGCGVVATAYYLPYLMKQEDAELADPAGFNYYHRSTRHLLDCIKNDRDPLLNVEWGRHI